MHSLLENYLTELSEYLSPLPVARRNDELREMRQHLLNVVIVSRETGQSEDEAALSAVDQFGAPQELGENVVWAWRRGRLLDKRDFWSAAVCAAVLTLVLPYLLTPLVYPYFLHASQEHPYPLLALVSGLLFMIAVPLLVGGVCGFTFSKRAVDGVIAATSVHLLWMAEYIQTVYGHHLSVSTPNFYAYIVCILVKALAMVLAAWVVNRWRTHRVQLSQG